MLIAFCGIDGSGKSTQLDMLVRELAQYNTYKTKQPTDFYRKYDRFLSYTSQTKKVDEMYLRELALVAAADKLRHYNTEIRPKIDSHIVISDRYVYSTYAYFYARGLVDLDWLQTINRYLPLPDITFYIDTNPIIAMKRVKRRDKNNMNEEEKNIEILFSAREIFTSEMWRCNKNYVVINGQKTKEQIHADIMKNLEGKIEDERYRKI